MVQMLIDHMRIIKPQQVILAAVQTARVIVKDISTALELRIFSNLLLRIEGAARELLTLDPGAVGGGGWFAGAGGGGEVQDLSRQLRSLELQGPAGRVPDVEEEDDDEEDDEEDDREGEKQLVSLLTSIWIECYELLAEFYAKVSNTCRMHGLASLNTCSTVPFAKCVLRHSYN